LETERRLVFVSTLDGNVTAVDVQDGTVLWSLASGPLLSGSPQLKKVRRKGERLGSGWLDDLAG
jgi:outer membrane protein assembly factor BamB